MVDQTGAGKLFVFRAKPLDLFVKISYLAGLFEFQMHVRFGAVITGATLSHTASDASLLQSLSEGYIFLRFKGFIWGIKISWRNLVGIGVTNAAI